MKKDNYASKRNEDEDIIVIHLGKVLTEQQYQEVVNSIVAFMDKRWPGFCKPSEFSN